MPKPKKRLPAEFALSNSERQSFTTCRRMWHFSYERRLSPLTVPTPFLVGNAVHKGLALFYGGEDFEAAEVVNDIFDPVRKGEGNRFLSAEQLGDLEKQAAMSTGMIQAYCATRRDDLKKWKVLMVEKDCKFRVGSRWDMYFTIDVVVEQGKKQWIVEHKTAASVDAGYIGRLALDDQISTYMVGAESLGFKPKGVIYNVLLKPRIRQKKKESYQEYLGRIHTLYEESPEEYNHREIVLRSKTELEVFEDELRRFTEEMARIKEGGFYAKNTGACITRFGSSCQFMPLCIEGDAALDRFKVREARSHHDEEDGW